MRILGRTLLAVLLGGLLILSHTVARATDETDYDFAFLADKVGDPPVMVTFQVDPENSVWCPDAGPHWEWARPWNLSIIRAAKKGDLIKRYHVTTIYTAFGRVVRQVHKDRYMPQDSRLRQIYPPPRWPFTYNDPMEAYRPLGES